ncbi:phage tail sheath C-terminal domain-containing protein [Microbacterium sp. 2FI]|uniref:phage tail sheath family protein n=1 Tax=Microbacterium sp. 2FI TaxID=2502193 RepID=UPI0010F7430A|nr:phage tail sheath C-terminal domain-containing protein [Microbacterium sp. 2FI]
MGRDDERDDFDFSNDATQLSSRDLDGLADYLEEHERGVSRRLVDEIPPGLRIPRIVPDLRRVRPSPIEGAPTTLTAFLGIATGDLTPVRVDGWKQYTQRWPDDTPLASAVEAYFRGGGQSAWIAPLAKLTPENASDAAAALHRDVSLVAVVDDPAPAPEIVAAVSAALSGRRVMLLVEGPWTDAATARSAMSGDPATTVGAAGPDVAVYWPRVRVPSPTGVRSIAPLGPVAGAIVAGDLLAGVFSAPTGSRGALPGALGPVVTATPPEIAQLNPLGLNVIRELPDRGAMVWGARTLTTDPEWRYISVRRGAHFITASIERGLTWTASQPNAEPLWADVRREVDGFLTNLWRSGALFGQKPSEAFFVRCDRTTMTETDIAEGRLICMVGFAPLRPAEFIVLRLTARTAVQP